MQHRTVDGYGRHRHDYLPPRIASLARSLATERPNGLHWLDYGCGKGTFLDEIRPLGLSRASPATIPASKHSARARSARSIWSPAST